MHKHLNSPKTNFPQKGILNHKFRLLSNEWLYDYLDWLSTIQLHQTLSYYEHNKGGYGVETVEGGEGSRTNIGKPSAITKHFGRRTNEENFNS